ncbi:MAG TPA: DUF4235 domain-containing protein [Jatrophihabitantaceae bacterium]|jgi:hypothetical protein|nr:DUF4235 domain-containing protein [Jatrophihabitantaceae bacterium]
MANIVGKIGMKVATIIVGIPVGIVTKKVVEQAWATLRPDDPPRKPNESGVRWGDAISWAALSAAGVVAADLATRKGAESAWRTVMGTEPPAPKQTKAQKKLEAAQEKVSVLD